MPKPVSPVVFIFEAAIPWGIAAPLAEEAIVSTWCAKASPIPCPLSEVDEGSLLESLHRR